MPRRRARGPRAQRRDRALRTRADPASAASCDARSCASRSSPASWITRARRRYPARAALDDVRAPVRAAGRTVRLPGRGGFAAQAVQLSVGPPAVGATGGGLQGLTAAVDGPRLGWRRWRGSPSRRSTCSARTSSTIHEPDGHNSHLRIEQLGKNAHVTPPPCTQTTKLPTTKNDDEDPPPFLPEQGRDDVLLAAAAHGRSRASTQLRVHVPSPCYAPRRVPVQYSSPEVQRPGCDGATPQSTRPRFLSWFGAAPVLVPPGVSAAQVLRRWRYKALERRSTA